MTVATTAVWVGWQGICALSDTLEDGGESAEDYKARCRKIKDKCIDECTNEKMPTGSLDGMPYHDCMRRCLERYDCWGVKY